VKEESTGSVKTGLAIAGERKSWGEKEALV
jgi:hypothetical protein